jgi:hypothetical protein
MSNGAEAGAYAAIAQAIKASGAIVRLEPEEFQKILSRAEAPLVVMAKRLFLARGYSYLTSYKGLAFFTRSREGLPLPGSCEVVWARNIWVPS